MSKRKNEQHGMSGTPMYCIWAGMNSRCRDMDNPNYGGRGISVYPEWESSFIAWLAYVGDRPSPAHSIDRIDNDGNYEPGNVRWALAHTQINNRSTTLDKLTMDGVERTIQEWSVITGIHYSTLRGRVKMKGWSHKRALTTPLYDQRGITRRKERVHYIPDEQS